MQSLGIATVDPTKTAGTVEGVLDQNTNTYRYCVR